MAVILRHRGSIFCHQKMTPVAPCNVNDIAYVTRINDESHFSWQAQYLVRLQGDICCSAQCK